MAFRGQDLLQAAPVLSRVFLGHQRRMVSRRAYVPFLTQNAPATVLAFFSFLSVVNLQDWRATQPP